MEKRRTDLRGLSTTDNYVEGDFSVLYNLRPVPGGGVVPCEIAQVERTEMTISPLESLVEIFLHQTGEYRHAVVITSGGRTEAPTLRATWYEVSKDGEATGDPHPIAHIRDAQRYGDFTGVVQSGNVLALVLERDIYYCLWQDGGYTALGVFPDLPELQMRAGKTHQWERAPRPMEMTPEQLKEAGAVVIGKADDAGSREEAFLRRVYQAWEGLIEKTKLERQEKDARAAFFDPVSITYALRLFDGRVTKPSAPLVILPTTYLESFYRPLMEPRVVAAADDGALYLVPPAINYYYVDVALPDLSALAKWSEVIVGIDFFATDPIDMRDGAVSLHLGLSSPYIRHSLRTGQGIGRLVSPYAYSGRRDMQGGVVPHRDIRGEEGDRSQPKQRIIDQSQCYLLQSIDLKRDVTEGAYYLAKDGVFELPSRASSVFRESDIRTQEVMPNGALTHHRYGGRIARVMNNRLRLVDTHTTFFDGFAHLFLWDKGDRRYNSVRPTQVVPEGSSLLIDVEIAANGAVHHVRKETEIKGRGISMPAMYSYPDPRAQRFTLYVRTRRGEYYEVLSEPLRPHPHLPIAYYLETEPIHTTGSIADAEEGVGVDSDTRVIPTERHNGTGQGRR